MKKSIVTLMVVLMTVINASSIVFAEDLTSYTYEGDINEDGLYHGQGKLYYKDLLFYEGDFANGDFNGEGTLYQVESDHPESSANTNKVKYQGHFKDGLYHGKGTLYFNYTLPEEDNTEFRGQEYEGKFQFGKYHGYGTEYNMNGEINNQGYFINGNLYNYEGPIDENGKMHGNGQLLNSEEKVMGKGKFVHGEIHGRGTLYLNEDRNQKYIGDFVHDQMEGKGSIYIDDNLYYQGSFVDGLKQGEGTLYFPDKSISYQGEFVNDRTKEQPFQIKSGVHLDKKLNGTYSIYVVLLDKYNTEVTSKHFQKMKETVGDRFDTIEDIESESEYLGFKATKDIGNIIDSNFQDEFLGFQTTAIKTKMMFINQYEIFSRQAFSLDTNLMNVSHEIFSPEKSLNFQVNGLSKQKDSDNHYIWMDIKGDEYLVTKFQLYNSVTIGATIAFVTILIGGMVYFRKKNKKRKIQQKE
ncbi:hypothetical protein [Virgibacillus halodenitrificans]|uniref:hypothetical protein n=1 Tax=Virgibacillus halodenitrificans TaxID=1482 RepID=UPI0013CE433C|nr:hypothetical protein [Virgibacillus halodenitrificans]